MPISFLSTLINSPRLNKTIWVAVIGAVMAISAGLGMVCVLYFQVYFGDDTYLKKSTILAKINEETSLFFLDEQTRIGSFFSEQHRRYVPIEEIPAYMINAVVASEDKYFYEHHGVNPIAIFKALQEGMQLAVSSGFRQVHFRGGSTITQQTVKNLLDKKEYSMARKFREAIAALQLERLYSKRQILEFYLNQFHVAHNGNGVGIAARYYFNKDVRDLGLVESAFIAGSVKGPSKYNPFIKYTPEDRKEAWKFANQRKNYVLRRMYEQGWINEAELRDAWDKPVPFNKGKFTSHEVALVSLIRSQLDRKEILQATGMENINELNQAGLRVFTTLDSDLQRSAQLMMRRNLSRLETVLQGFKPEENTDYKALRDLEVGEFYFGKVAKIVGKGAKPEIQIDFGLPKGTVPYEAVVRFAKWMDIAVPETYQKRITELLNTLKVGDVIFCEVREYNSETHQAVLELHRHPQVSGGMIALDKGEVRALVSGFDPKGYNRAIFATRQPGSVFKMVTYLAAVHLGWSILDRLDNERRIFPYQGQFYYPQPDHDSPFSSTSMIWAGTKSENLASIYLNSRLVEKLNFDQFKGVMDLFGLLPLENEVKRDYHFRVAREMGVQIDNEGIREFELGNAINDLAPDLVFSGQNDLLTVVRKMWWGRGYADEIQRLYQLDPEEYSEKEQNLRLELVKNNYQRHTILATGLEGDWAAVEKKVRESTAEAALADSEVGPIIARFRVVANKRDRPALGYFRNLPEEAPKTAVDGDLARVLQNIPGRALNALDVQSIWGPGSLFSSRAGITLEDVQLHGFLPLSLYRRIAKRTGERYDAVMALQDPYDLYQYYHHHDFRIALGLNYLKKLCKEMGVFSQVEPVLSFPLGTNVVSVAEVGKIYQTMVEGKVYRFYKDGPPNQINFIRRIEDRMGNLLYEPTREERALFKPEYATQMRQILRRVVTHGTGGWARGEMYLNVSPDGTKVMPVRIPVFGKTGTTNDYRTASFAGFVPYPVQKNATLDPRNSYVIASYVGYDFNKSMIRGGYKITGAAGALPPWTEFAKDILEKKKYTDFLDKLDLGIISKGEWPLLAEQGTVGLRVDLPRGVVLNQEDAPDNESYATTNYGVTGEDAVNEFELTTSIKTVIRLPLDKGEGGIFNPLRMVAPFEPYKSEEDKSKVKPTTQGQHLQTAFPSKVDPNAAANLPGMAAPPAPQQDVSLQGAGGGGAPTAGGALPEPPSPGAQGSPLPPAAVPTIKSEPPRAPNAVPGDAKKAKDTGFVEGDLW